MKKENLNQNGELPSDKPGKELVNPPKKGTKLVSSNTEGSKNTTAKDPKLGSRHTTR